MYTLVAEKLVQRCKWYIHKMKAAGIKSSSRKRWKRVHVNKLFGNTEAPQYLDDLSKIPKLGQDQ